MTTTKKVYGIDLGTTYSAIAFVNEDRKAEIIKNLDDEPTMPSVVYFESATNAIVGKLAKDFAGRTQEDVDRTVAFVKQDMDKPERSFRFFGKDYSPIDISSLIIKQLIKDARAQGKDIQDVVITVPAYFDAAAKERTRQAGILAGKELEKEGEVGINVLSLTNEPTAAAIEYAVTTPTATGKTVLVYDLGGGTFDVTVVKISEKEVEVLGISGNSRLGGKDWDDRIADYYISEFKEQKGVDLRSDTSSTAKGTLLAIRERAESDKKILTKRESIRTDVTFATERIDLELSRQKFDEITGDLLAKTLPYVEEALKLAGKQSIDTILLVGGSTYMPQVKSYLSEKLRGRFNDIISFDPNQSVAKGAALFAEMKWIDKRREEGKTNAEIAGELGRQVSEVNNTKTILEKAAYTYGVGFYNPDKDANYVGNLIMMGAAIPAREETVAHTIHIQRSVRMSIYQSRVTDKDSYEMALNTLLKEKDWDLGREVTPQEDIKEILTLSQEGTLTLSASISGCPPFSLPLELQGVYSKEEMDAKADSLSSVHTRSER